VQVTYQGREFELSHPDKVLFPQAKVTKAGLVDYYRRVAEVMVPHLAGRPLTLERHPDGVSGPSFYQKEVPDYFPDWVARAEVATKEGGQLHQVLCEDEATLVYLATQACITLHPWLSRADQPRHPDRLIFDLDPSGDDFGVVRSTARALRDLVGELSLEAFVQTTGSRGLHIVVPIERQYEFNEVRAFARDVATKLVRGAPSERTLEQSKSKRGRRVYVDIMRNGYSQSAAAAYSVRARPGAPVATPIEWDELGSVGPDSYTLSSVPRRMAQRADPWAGMAGRARPLGPAPERLAGKS
jgi:bifunctional non-homologous end joining protein LigD